MMKRITKSKRLLSLILSCALLLTGCMGNGSSDSEKETQSSIAETSSAPDSSSSSIEFEDKTPSFSSISDPDLSTYIEDSINAELESRFASDDYHIDNIASVYVSKEYIETVEYNSKENIFFGYSLKELDEQFNGKRYVFTLGDDGKTAVKEFEEYDDAYIKMLKDVAIGAGVIVFCVTVSVVSGGTVAAVFAASAKSAATMALSGGAMGGLTSGIVTGIQTGDMEQALKAAGTAGAQGFKIGAITGAIAGGITKMQTLKSGSGVKHGVTGNSSQIGKESEEYAQKFYQGEKTQVSYLNGKEVPYATKGATRPDILVENPNGTLKAIEVKNYNLESNFSGLKRELDRQVGERVTNLPSGYTQEIALVTKGRNYSQEFLDKVVTELQDYLAPTYGGKIPVKICA